MKELLKKICLRDNQRRAAALQSVLKSKNVPCENWENMALVVPAKTADIVVLCAHYDAVPGSFGYNDNGMSLVTILSMLGELPEYVETVFTNGEELGFLGAEHYLENRKKRICGCVNLDVCGFGDMVYCDPMSSELELPGCKNGMMPPNDGCVFSDSELPVLTLSTGPAECSFDDGISRIGETIHNRTLDNRLDVLNFELPGMVSRAALMAIHEFSKALREK